jgi:DoxX-like protein
MTIALWIAQGFVALVFLLTGALKVVTPKENLVDKMHWAATWPPGRIKLLGLAEVAGALGLLLPTALHIAPVLTPIAAGCLALLMIGAVQTHRRLHESSVPALVLGLVCVVIAVGWLRL